MSPRNKLLSLGLGFLLTLAAGFEGRNLITARDPIGIPTSCFGHTATAKMGQKKTPAECDELLSTDLLVANSVVDSCVHVPLNVNQRGAFVSLAFNVGRGKKGVKDGFCVLYSGRQTTLVRKLNAGDYVGACNELSTWVLAGGKIWPGLVKRRAAERALCLTAEAA